jgi:hypothetical protein
LLAVVAIKLLPLVLAVTAISAAVLLVVAGLLFSGVAAVAGVGVAALVALLVPVIVLAAVLSPIWIPVLIVVGIIGLIRRSNRVTA